MWFSRGSVPCGGGGRGPVKEGYRGCYSATVLAGMGYGASCRRER